jgi:hypothetical protein
MFCGIASVLVMIYWNAGPPPAGVVFLFLFLYLLPFKRLNVDMDRQTDRQTDRRTQTVTYSEAEDEA